MKRGGKMDRRQVINNVRQMMKGRVKNEKNWIMVMYIFGVGSTTAHQICKDCGIDPESMS